MVDMTDKEEEPICPLCGFNPNAPIGKCVEDSKKGEDVAVELNDNGLKMVFCPRNHKPYSGRRG